MLQKAERVFVAFTYPLADVMVYCRNLLDKLNLDEDEIINMKMTMNEAKYPVEKAKGSNKKYTEL